MLERETMLLTAALALLLAPEPGVSQVPRSHEAEVPALRRVLVLGASLSHGYGFGKDAGARLSFADVVDASIKTAHDPVRAQTSLLFFADPLPTGRAQVAAGASENPTLVIGIDYLFWYGYGLFPREEDRLAMLEKGLAELETFACPVLVGDFPDISDAARSSADSPQGARAGLLAPQQVPTPGMRKKLNERLREWAAARKNIVVAPLSDFVARRQAGLDVEIHGNRWPGSTLAGLVQADRLHPTLEGAIAIWIGSLEALVAGRDDVPATAFDWDAGSISRRLLARAEARRASEVREKTKEGAGVGGR